MGQDILNGHCALNSRARHIFRAFCSRLRHLYLAANKHYATDINFALIIHKSLLRATLP